MVTTNRGKGVVEIVPACPKPKSSISAYGSMPGLLGKLPLTWDSPDEDAKIAALCGTGSKPRLR